MKTQLKLVLAFGLALAGVAAGCGDEGPSKVDGGGGAAGGTGGNKPGTGGVDGGAPDGGGDADNSFGAFVIDLIKNKTNETGTPAPLEGRTFDMSEDVGTFVELLK